MSTPQSPTHSWSLIPPTNPGTYYAEFGWRVVDATGLTAYSGDESGARRYLRDLEAR